jgi:lysophospholipase L1-like esterase
MDGTVCASWVGDVGRPHLRKVLVLSLALNVLVLAVVAWLGLGPGRSMLMGSFLEKHQARRVSNFEAFPLVPDDIVFLGDSITEGGPWEEMFPDLRVRNRGVGGDTSEGVHARLEQITRATPTKVFLLIGTNDLFRGDSEDEIVSNITDVLDRLKQETPDTEVYLQSVLPRAPSYRADIEALNARLAEVALEHGSAWIDLYPAFLDPETGGIRAELSNDELHLLGPGYKLWKEQIEVQVRTGATPVEPPIEPGAEPGAEPEIDEPEIEEAAPAEEPT